MCISVQCTHSACKKQWFNSEARSEWTLRAQLKKWTKETEACARTIAQSEGKDWGSMWTLTQESCRDEAETVCRNCYVRGI